MGAARGFAQEPQRQSEASDFFENRIRPILIDHCQPCHSVATQKSSGGLLLDSKEGWTKGGDSGPAILPGNPAGSLLIQAIRGSEGASLMPPAESRMALSDSQIRDLEAWVLQGAFDPRKATQRIGGMTLEQAESWWAFQPLKNSVPPQVQHPEWVWNPIDQFVVASLEANELEPLSTASKQAWLRRVSLDLTGLVPTQEQLREYLLDPSDQADSAVVDRLLGSFEHAERYGRHWLDVARYADTAGDGADYPVREAYKYRDWVIRAIHSNQPWDQFLREQIAGDLYARDLVSRYSGELPHEQQSKYADLVTATGFLAIGKRYGYAPNADFQHLDFADAIDSVGRSVLGLSIGCARCHDHKYDPISMQDYYGLYGIFQSTQWAFPGGEEHKRPTNFPPLVPPGTVAQLEKQRSDRVAQLDAEIQQAQALRMQLDPNFFAGGVDLDFESQEIGKPPVKAWLSAGPNVVTTDSQSPYEHLFGPGTRGVRVGSGTPHEGVRYVFDRKLKLGELPLFFSVDFRIPRSANQTENQAGSCRLYLGRGVIESIAIECSLSKDEFALKHDGAWKVVAKLQPDTWYHLVVKIDPSDSTWSGSLNAQGAALQLPRLPLPTNWDRIADTFICDGFGHVPGVLTRDLDNIGLDDQPFANFGDPPRARRPSGTTESQQQMAVQEEKIKALQARRAQALAEVLYPLAYGVSDSKTVDAKIQLRGEPSHPAEEVPRRFLSILGGPLVPKQTGESGRRELANWLTDPARPLAARVFVNRVWHWHFGRGLVPTTSDFGIRGQGPSHPELLDYLAGRFIASGWDVRQLHRWIVLSRTYHLTSDLSDDPADKRRAEAAQKSDPENRLLWRYTKRPMDAESLRDSMLAVSGLLNRDVPQEHPFPPVETWGFTIHNPFYGLYESMHRSVYLMQQRNRKHPFLSLFDGADPNLSVDERKTTTTPTQSLFLMNSPLVHEASESLSKILIASTQDSSKRLEDAFEILLGRSPSQQELRECIEFVDVYSQREPKNSSGDVAQKAWGALCRVLMTSNSFLYID